MKQSFTTIFFRDPKYQGPHIVQTYLKKEKSTNKFKFFGDSNTRFFTLNMQTFEFYYTPRDQYQAKDIKYIDIASIKYVVDRGCEKNSKGQCKEWTFQIIIYFTNKYTILFCQNDTMKSLWLNAFKNIIRISTQQSLLHNPNSQNQNNPEFNHMVQSNNTLQDNSMKKESFKEIYSAPIQDSNSQNQSIDSKDNVKQPKNIVEQKQSIDSQNNSRRNSNNSYDSNDSASYRKKNKQVFKETQKKQVYSQYKKKQKFEAFWNEKVIASLMEKLRIARRKIQEKQNIKREQAKQQSDSDRSSITEPNQNEKLQINEVEQVNLVEIESLDKYDTPQVINGKSDFKVFRKNEEKHSNKKIVKNSPQTHHSTGKKHQANIFDDILKSENEETPSINIKFQSKKSQNGWDGNDINLLQNILRENSNQLKGNQNDEKQSNDFDDGFVKQQPKEDFLSYSDKKQDIPEVSVINSKPQIKKESSNGLALNDYDDWDVELDNIVTPAIGNKKALYQNVQNQQFSNNNNSKHIFNQQQNIYNNNSSLNTNINRNQSQISQNNLPKQQIAVIDNDYDNWDDEM